MEENEERSNKLTIQWLNILMVIIEYHGFIDFVLALVDGS